MGKLKGKEKYRTRRRRKQRRLAADAVRRNPDMVPSGVSMHRPIVGPDIAIIRQGIEL